jgi:hypothetical protein
MVERFQHIEAAFTPLIGLSGVVALYEQSHYLTARSYPWLAPLKEGRPAGMELEELGSSVAQQSDEAAAAGVDLLMKTFHDLVANLVGEAVTKQLLGRSPLTQASTAPTPLPRASDRD